MFSPILTLPLFCRLNLEGVFVENVEWCLVVTTIECVFLSALYRSDTAFGPGHGGDALLLVANVFKVSSDEVRLTEIAGSKDGRIYLGGENGEIYAIDYWGEPPDDSTETKLNDFYDGTLDLGPVLTVDTSLTERIRKRLGETLSHQSVRRCQKLDFGNAKDGYSLTNIFFKNGDGVSKLVVDEDRGLLFALTKSGYISVRSISDPTNVLQKLNVMDTAKAFLERIGRRAESATHQAAVGGHDMARNIAKRGHAVLRPVSIQNISISESQKYCLVIVTSGGLRLYFSTALRRRLALTHIRGAQPLLNTSNANFEVDSTGGYLPSISDCTVSAAHCNNGLLLAAYAAPGDNSVCLVASGTDSQLREMKKNGKDCTQVPGGITESLTYPLGETKLAGKEVWDIGEIEICKQAKSLQTMTQYSATPSDQDLRRPSLPRPFSFPRQTLNGSYIDNAMDMTKSALLGLLGSPKRGRITKSDTGRFRLSKRSGASGFSPTAAENRSNSRSTGAQTYKLKAWLLQPKQVSLDFMAAQYPPTDSQVIVVNADGFHVFTRTVPIKQFELAISHSDAESFFRKFRRRECCSMGLALAMGLNSTPRTQDQAKQLVLQQGKLPSLRPRSNELGNRPATTSTTNADDSLVPVGYEFSPSPLCEGLVFLVSRLLRPVWHKVLVVVTEGPKVTQTGMPNASQPAKVELLLDETAMEDLLYRLVRLRELLVRMFEYAVVNVPGMINQNLNSAMEVDDSNGRSIFANSQAMNPMQNSLLPLVVDTTRLSRKLEERNIHSLYRTLSRSIQLVKLLSILCNQRQMRSLLSSRAVHWGMLHGITFSEFVESSECQDRVEGLLNTLIVSTQGRTRNSASQAVEEFTRYLSENCYYFFPIGSQSACVGHQLASRALAYGNRSTDFDNLRIQAVQSFLEASHHWRNPGLITGRSIYDASESHGDLAQVAESNGSPLALAVGVLLALEDGVSVAKMCLQVAANFQRGSVATSTFSSKTRALLKWEAPLYHQGQVVMATSSGGGKAQSPRKASIRSEVTAEDVVATCHALIFGTLSKLFKVQQDLASTMLSYCVSVPDKMFLRKLFEFLMLGNQDVLLSIASPDLEQWLEATQDSYLLWRYLSIHGKQDAGGKVAIDIASDRSKRLSLEERIQWLERGVASFGELTRSNNSVVKFHKKEIVAKLTVARLQQRVLQALQSDTFSKGIPNQEVEKLKADVEKLKNDLVPPSELYNDFAAAWGLAEECLRIFHACNESPDEESKRLWRHLICGELLPSETRSNDVFQYLAALAADFRLDDQVTLLREHERSSRSLFEDGAWAEKFRNKVVVLGNEIYKPNVSTVFSVDYLIKILEGSSLFGCPDALND